MTCGSSPARPALTRTCSTPALTADGDHAIIGGVGAIAAGRGVTRAQVAHGKPVVTRPLVGANATSQIDDAVASLDIELTASEVAALERPYTPR